MSYPPDTLLSTGSPVDNLHAPLYGATPTQAVGRFWRKYAIFSGRASRSEYWWWTLISLVVTVLLEVVHYALMGGDHNSAAAAID